MLTILRPTRLILLVYRLFGLPSPEDHPMRSIVCLTLVACASASIFAQAPSQPTVWAAKPDIPAFEKTVNNRLAAAQASIGQVVAVKGQRTIENTLGAYDEAVRNLNTAAYL